MGETWSHVAPDPGSPVPLVMRMTGRAAISILALVAVACGSASPSSTSTTTAATSTTVEPIAPGEPTTTTAAPGATTTIPPGPVVEIRGGVVDGPDVVAAERGETVEVLVLSDVDHEVHVHGYDLVFEVTGGVPMHLTFVADIAGIFEVEVHTGHTHLFDIEVSG